MKPTRLRYFYAYQWPVWLWIIFVDAPRRTLCPTGVLDYPRTSAATFNITVSAHPAAGPIGVHGKPPQDHDRNRVVEYFIQPMATSS